MKKIILGILLLAASPALAGPDGSYGGTGYSGGNNNGGGGGGGSGYAGLGNDPRWSQRQAFLKNSNNAAGNPAHRDPNTGLHSGEGGT